jgi:hypothetical protein
MVITALFAFVAIINYFSLSEYIIFGVFPSWKLMKSHTQADENA